MRRIDCDLVGDICVSLSDVHVCCLSCIVEFSEGPVGDVKPSSPCFTK